ncbi:calcium-binding and coiled-coil domain-containing protein 1-like, partial [Heterodontus francisci]|uniref:calcium-binding and coiled-coil domain-containing protein 1-like n=1 Tax=Heterodontus francisci TaxID=7792 RepID=UPI00355B0D7B
MDGSKVIPPESKVTFHNVAGSYVPGTALECHYTLSPQPRWASKDWIGLFQVGWRSARDYYTFVWSPAPQGQGERSRLNCCVRLK